MTKEDIMDIKTYEEFDSKRKELKGIEWDREMIHHISELVGKISMEDDPVTAITGMHQITKEEILALKTVEEWEEIKKHEINDDLLEDQDVINHISDIIGKADLIRGYLKELK